VTLFKEHQQDKFKKYSGVVKEGRLVLEKDKKEQIIELLLLHTIDTRIEEVKTKEPVTIYLFLKLLVTCAETG